MPSVAPAVFPLRCPPVSDSPDGLARCHRPQPSSPFEMTQSRVLKMHELTSRSRDFLTAWSSHSLPAALPAPSMVWSVSPAHNTAHDTLFLFFKSHPQARSALFFIRSSNHLSSFIAVQPALESELEPLSKLQRFDPLLMSSSFPEPLPSSSPMYLDPYPYTISSNPPQPKSSFRLGDWICSLVNCGAHNFGKNISCIGCGSSRADSLRDSNSFCIQPPTVPLQQQQQQQQQSQLPQHMSHQRSVTSPRFLSSPVPVAMEMSAGQPQSQRSLSYHSPRRPTTPHHSHLLLTPSGKAFASGGQVRNISDDPLVPCIMYWPDNEPLPERGQIRPTAVTGCTQPPILNTGNRGPISHQPGDWICLKCNYLNWRRRKVCQTCFPYAEGNGDSISAPVQAERIALLTSVLRQTQQEQTPGNSDCDSLSDLSALRAALPSTSAFPPRDLASPLNPSLLEDDRMIYQTRSAASTKMIYQTTGFTLDHQPRFNVGPGPALLPSFLQDFVDSPIDSPTHPLSSPASTSSSNSHGLDYDELLYYASTTAASSPPSSAVSLATSPEPRCSALNSPPVMYRADALSPSSSVPGSPSPASAQAASNIWSLDGEESRLFRVVSSSSLRFPRSKQANTSPAPNRAPGAGRPSVLH